MLRVQLCDIVRAWVVNAADDSDLVPAVDSDLVPAVDQRRVLPFPIDNRARGWLPGPFRVWKADKARAWALAVSLATSRP